MIILRFTHPEFLVLLVAVPLLIITHYLLFRFTKRRGMHFSNFETLRRVTGKKVLTRNTGQLVLRVLAIAAIILALAQPNILYTGTAQKSDYVLAVDTSGSMTANDLTPSRFEAARSAALRFVDELNGTAKVGVIGFSGTVEVGQVLTSDMGAVKDALQQMEIRTISGTDIPGAIITGTNLLLDSNKGRVLILLTDGSSTTGGSQVNPVQNAVAYAEKHDVVIHTIGVGKMGSVPTGYLPKIYNVTAVYDPTTLEYIANQTGGKYIPAQNSSALSAAYDRLLSHGESTLRDQSLSLGSLLVGLLLLFIEWGLSNTRWRLLP